MVVALLQLLLANFTSSTIPLFQEADEETAPSTPGELETVMIDPARDKEILGKAITGILILMLKWFRVSRNSSHFQTDKKDVLKFEYLSQLLYDSNCHILIARLLSIDASVLSIRFLNELPNLGYHLSYHLHIVSFPFPSKTAPFRHPSHVVEHPNQNHQQKTTNHPP
jgi:hypothetical protein